MGLGKPGLVPLLEEEILPPAKTEEPVAAKGSDNPQPPLGDSGIVTGIKSTDPRQLVDNENQWPDPVGPVQLAWDFEVVSRTPALLSVWDGLGTGAIPSGTGTVVALELAPINYVSVNTGALTIDQSDPTNILFSATPAAQLGTGDITGLFGAGKAIWVSCTGISGTGPKNLVNGTVEQTHPYITYTTGGHFDIVKGGVYMYSLNGKVAKPTSPTGSDRTDLVFTNNTGSILFGVPGQQRQSVYLGGQDFTGLTDVDVVGTVTVLATVGTRLTPTIETTWGGTWSNVDCVITSVFGPGSLGTIEYTVTPQYGYQQFVTGDTQQRSFYSAFFSAPNQIGNGSVPPHSLTATTYFGDAVNPLWYPNGPMYVIMPISPVPNTLLADFSYQILEWDSGTPPADIIVKPYMYNAGVGVAVQGVNVWLPFSGATPSYANTSFIVRCTFANIESVFDIYFKQCDPGENGAVHVSAESPVTLANLYTMDLSYSPNTDSLFIYYLNSETNGNRAIVPSSVADGTEQLAADKHFTIWHPSLWDDPDNITWTYEFQGMLFTLNYYASYGYPFVLNPNELANFMDSYMGTSYGGDENVMRADLGITDPTITYVPMGDMLVDTPKYFSRTPWGHWRIRWPIGGVYDIQMDQIPDGFGGAQYSGEFYPTIWRIQGFWKTETTPCLTYDGLSPALPSHLIYP